MTRTPEDIGEGDDKPGNERDINMCGELPRHLYADEINRILIDAERRDIHRISKAAKEPVGDEVRVIRRQDDMVKDDILEYECHYGSGHNSKERPYNMPSQLFEVLEKGHVTVRILVLFFAGGHFWVLI